MSGEVVGSTIEARIRISRAMRLFKLSCEEPLMLQCKGKLLVLAAMVAAVLLGCSDELSLADYENYDVGVWFSTPDGDQVFLGVVHGAHACGATAANYAASNRYSDWAYVCCTHRKGSDCHEKIR